MKVVGIDKDKSGRFEGPASRYLLTDEVITSEWKHFFDELTGPSFTAVRDNISVYDQFIVVVCSWVELQQEIERVNRYCGLADAALLKHNNELKRAEDERASKEASEKQRADQFYDALKF